MKDVFRRHRSKIELRNNPSVHAVHDDGINGVAIIGKNVEMNRVPVCDNRVVRSDIAIARHLHINKICVLCKHHPDGVVLPDIGKRISSG